MLGSLTAGQLVDERYALEEPLGSNAFGTIWRAQDRGLDRRVCLRPVRFCPAVADNPEARKEILMAARKAIRVDHPGAIHLWDAFLDGDHLVMVTELARGRTLRSLVVQKGKLSPKRVAAIGLDLLDPILAANALGIPHGWITPGAVFVPDKADKGATQLAEFGLAPSFRDTSAYSWLEMVGDATYVAPEQASLRGNSQRADLYSLGATLYFAVEGAPPFPSTSTGTSTGSGTATMLAVIRSDHPRLMERAGPLTGLLERLLAKDPDRRPFPEEIRSKLAEVAGVPLETPAPEPAADTPVASPDVEAPRRRSRRERRQAEAEADAEFLETVAPAEEEHDWNSVLDAGVDTPSDQWVDWSAGGDGAEGDGEASDVWLPGTEAEPPPPEGFAVAALAPVPPGTPEEAEAEKPAETAEATAQPEVPPAENDALVPAASVPAAVTAVQPAAAQEEPPRRYRSTPSWPPPQGRRSVSVTLLVALVMVVMVALLVTNGRLLGRSREAVIERSAKDRPVLATDPSSVPANWIAYRHPAANYGISYPPGWTLREEGPLVIIREPASGTELRIDYKQPPGPDPEKTWQELEASFSSQHPGDYRRLQLSPASYMGFVAALWEFTFTENNVPTHAVDLGFLTKKYSFALYFEAPAATWQNTLPTFYAFLSSFQPPK